MEEFSFGCLHCRRATGCRGEITEGLLILELANAAQARKVESALRVGTLLRDSTHPIRQIYNLCGNSSLHVLGTVNPTVPTGNFDPSHLVAYTEDPSPFPSVFCPKTCNISVQVIIFNRPSPRQMQYMSLNPISLVLGDKNLGNDGAPHGLGNDDEDYETESADKAGLVQKLKLHTVIRHNPSQKEVMLPTILAQINCSSELAKLLAGNSYLLGTRPKRSLSVSEKVVESATTIRDYIIKATWQVITVWVWPLLTRAFVMALIFHRMIAEVILRVLEWRPRPERAALKDISATAQQVDIRLQQFCYWPMQYLTLRKRKNDWESVTDRHPDYIRFFNSLWLVANDVIIGIALGSYIIDNATWVACQIDTVLMGWTVEGLREMILWLMDWPAGLKLNTELAIFLGDLFIWVIDLWKGKSATVLLSSLPWSYADSCRVRDWVTTFTASRHLLHRLLKLRWSYHAYFHVFRPFVILDCTHILFLYSVSSHIPLATHNNNVSFPPLQGQKAQRATKSD